MINSIEEVGDLYRYLLVEYMGFYRAPKDKDVVFWKGVLKFCKEHQLEAEVLLICQFEYHKKNFDSYPYPNQLYGAQTLPRYQAYVAELQVKYPYKDIPLQAMFKVFSISNEILNDCYRVRTIAKELNLTRYDAALSIYNDLSPYTVISHEKLCSWLKILKPESVQRYYECQRELSTNPALKNLLTEILKKEWYGRSISIRHPVPSENISTLSQRS